MTTSVVGGSRRVIWILSVLLLGGFLSISLISYRVAHDSISAQIADNALPLTSDNIYSEIQQDLLRPIFISSLMAQDTFVRDWALAGEEEAPRMVRYLNEIQQQYNTMTSFFVSDKTRSYYHSTGVLRQVSEDKKEDEWYFRVRDMSSEEDYEINIDIDTANPGITTVFINYRVYDYAGRFIGVTGVGLEMEMVKRLIEVYQKRYGRKVFFMDRQGEVTLHGAAYEGAENIRNITGLNKYATQILATPSSSLTYQRNGKTVYLNSRLVSEFDWYLMVEQEEDAAEERLMNTLLGNLLLSLVVTGVVLFFASLTIRRYQSRLEEMAATDKLTGATSRQVFESLYEKILSSAKRHCFPLSMIMLDIDYFKKINDTYGHLMGDVVLKAIVQETRSCIRESDIICRWGGEEFLLLLPDCTRHHAGELAEKIRLAVEQRVVTVGSHSVSVTVSLGVTELAHNDELVDLINRADKALYKAKADGRNGVVLD
jgi:diguanylate cyclase (GGDEF)-like protein